MKPIYKKTLDIAIKHSSKISFLGYICGIVWLAALAHSSLNNSTYFSENALLPGMVDTHYDTHHSVKVLKSKIEKLKDRNEMLMWLLSKMSSIGLESYQHNFTIIVPEEVSNEGKIVGTNVYGILRAPRIARTEALVFSIPFKEENQTFNELVLLLSLAEHFRNNIYWSKDIIFLVVDQKELGMQSWLDEYHGVTSKYIESSPMLGRSGGIQAAINIEFYGKTINQMEVLVEGVNGQLPNLDLVNMVVRLCGMEHIGVYLKKTGFTLAYDGWDEYRNALSTMGLMMFTQASGQPTSNHGLFLKYGIEAVTLRGIQHGTGGSVGISRLGRALEGMFRSLNNLLERFHQSFFFYLLSSTDRYISIGLYMPPLGCLMIGPALSSIACWVWSVAEEQHCPASRKETKTIKQKESEVAEEQTKKENVDGNKENGRKEEDHIAEENKTFVNEEVFTQIHRHFGKVLRVFLAAHIAGLLIYVTPVISKYIRPVPFNLDPCTFSIGSTIILFLSSLLLPFFVRLSTNFSTRDVLLLKSFALVFYTCAVGCLATINFSFGYFLAVFTVPSFIFGNVTKNKLRRLIHVFFVLLSSPLSILFILTLIYTFLTSQNIKPHEELVKDAVALFTKSLVSSLRDSYLFGTWSYSVTTLIILPNWLLFWCIAWA